VLFCRSKDATKAMWDGHMAGQEGAIEEYGADDSFPIDDLDEILPRMLEQKSRIFYAMGCNQELDRRLSEWITSIKCQSRSGLQSPLEIIELDHYLHDLRLYKSRSEISLMRKAANISASAHKKVMQASKPGMKEYQLETVFEHECAMQGAREQAYPSIVGCGDNACVLHYIDNHDELADGKLLLIDAGCELDYYASDITRTFPVNGRFSPAQAELYQIVLDAQLAAIDKVRPGNHWNDPHEAAVRVICRGLLRLGILKGTYANAMKKESYRKYYMHRTGHWLGMDVHDVGDYKVDGAWRLLEPGMVLTVEPGIYIPENASGVAKKYRGIGIRIEDDVVVTRDGHDILSKNAPKQIAEIEALMAAG
ncbi:MAG: aminopeptidase P N-terminal domain-containing protein, partial [Chromatiales bacterium]|jgi:Xaa-Pro aminopeptidase